MWIFNSGINVSPNLLSVILLLCWSYPVIPSYYFAPEKCDDLKKPEIFVLIMIFFYLREYIAHGIIICNLNGLMCLSCSGAL